MHWGLRTFVEIYGQGLVVGEAVQEVVSHEFGELEVCLIAAQLLYVSTQVFCQLLGEDSLPNQVHAQAAN